MKTLEQVFDKAVEIENEAAEKFNRTSLADQYYIKNNVIFNETGSVLFDPENEGVSDGILFDFANEE